MSLAITLISAEACSTDAVGLSRATPRLKNGPRRVGGSSGRKIAPQNLGVTVPEFETAGNDADDRVVAAIRHDLPPHHIRIRPVATPPKAFAQEHGSRPTRSSSPPRRTSVQR